MWNVAKSSILENFAAKIFASVFSSLYFCHTFGSQIHSEKMRLKGNPVQDRNYPRSCELRIKSVQ